MRFIKLKWLMIERYIRLMKDVLASLNYNSIVILSFFFLCLVIFFLNYISKDKLNRIVFSNYRSSLFSPLTYIRFFTHIFGHQNWQHFMNNFLYILLIGPMIEEKYGSVNLLIMIMITALVTGIFNFVFTKRILGASGIVYMLIILSSAVNIDSGKIPVTLILICLFYIVNEVFNSLTKKDNISHASHLLGGLCGLVFCYVFK